MNLIQSINKKTRWIVHRFCVDHFPRIIIDRIWRREYGYTVDWKNPRDLNEKIQWLTCYGDTRLWPVLADKYRVRDYVAKKGYTHLLTQLYGVWTNAKDIDFDSLPERFVLKCNHDCGSAIIVDKSKGFDREAIICELNNKLRKKFGYDHCEPHYNRIPARVVAEEYLESKSDTFSKSLVDYKVWCFNGKACSIFVCYNRQRDSVFINLYDLNWHAHPEYMVYSQHFRQAEDIVRKPDSFDAMIRAAEDLSVGLPEARVDFYDIDGKLYFGEITLSSSRGRMEYFTKEYLKELGGKVVL